MEEQVCILGAGMTGLAAGVVSGLPIYEAETVPGGICSSYYMRPGDNRCLYNYPKDGNVYRFDVGGGHWIHSLDPLMVKFLSSFVSIKSYLRKSAVYFPDSKLVIPYPIQNNLRYLGPNIAMQALNDVVNVSLASSPIITMGDWLQARFGHTLCKLFFDPFHELYTAGLYNQIALQDPYKSPVDLPLVIQGAFEDVPNVGYNVKFIYPVEGLNVLAQRMAEKCQVHYGKRVVHIDVASKKIIFDDGSSLHYKSLISTLPLNRMIEMTELKIEDKPDPASSVLVLNIGAQKGPCCPNEHWLYIPSSKSGFHRVGFYSNVDSSFLPISSRVSKNRVSLYAEKAYPEAKWPSCSEIKALGRSVVKELQEWEWIREAEVVDPTLIDVAYSWFWPCSQWRQKAVQKLESYDIHQMGRFACWNNQGIIDSMRDGLIGGAVLGYRKK